MKTLRAIVIGLSFLSLPVFGLSALIQPGDLRCEYLRDPQGIDARQPRLSWVSESKSAKERGKVQTAYRILVATDLKLLKAGKADLWDSGQVSSGQSVHVRYAGKPLQSGALCYWTVRVWNEESRASDWSAPARWSMGLLQASDWKGQWVGKDEPERSAAISGTQWIWAPGVSAAQSAPIGSVCFRKTVDVPVGRALKRAQWMLSGDNELTAWVNGQPVGTHGNFKVAAAFEVAGQLKPGRNVLAVLVKNVGDGPNPAGLTGVLKMEFTDGAPVLVATDDSWKASDREVAGWEKPEFEDTAWSGAAKLGAVGMQPWGDIAGQDDRRLPARWLRKEFQVDRPVRRATAHFAGLGLSELYLNGQKVGDHVLSPGLTEYSKHVLYVTHDVTASVRQGANALGVVLGNGRYYAPRAQVPTDTRGYGYPKMLLQLDLEYVDGGSAVVVSDGSWKLTTDGPVLANNEYDGEEYDARKELRGWSEAGFNDAGWSAPQLVSGPAGGLVAQMMEPIRVTEVLKPVGVSEPRPGMFVFDMGQNMVGWCRLRVSGPAGTAVTLRHAEVLKPDGTLYLDNIRSAKVTDVYTLKGGGAVETWEPRFTYHGFRYVEVTGFPGKPDLSTLEGCVVHDDVASAGEWKSSNALLNRFLQNVRWGVRGNYRSISTDCPQRDERQGWLGDRSQECKGETYLFNTAALYSKWLMDMADSQKENGSVPDVCPPYWPIYSDNVTWPSTTVIAPGHLQLQYGDTAILERHYPSMQKWVEYMGTFLKDDLMPRDTYGDWCVPPEDPKLIHSQDPMRKTHPEILGTTYYIHCLELLSRYATVLGKTEDARRYTEVAGRVERAFNAKYLRSDGTQYDNGSQTSCVLPLAFDLVPKESQNKIFAHLVDKITTESRNHVGTGLIGGQFLMRTLSDNGRADLAYTLATNTDYPSWGYMVAKGATTVWELWNGDTADPAMNSGNHVMLVGDYVIWLYEYLAGIRPDPEQPGFKHILMKPYPVGDLTSVEASHRSPYGWIRSSWRRAGGSFAWDIEVPVNSSATVYVPAEDPADVTESGRRINRSPGIHFLRSEAGHAVYTVGSGTYHFGVR